VHIEGLVADRRAFSPQAGLRLAPHTRDLEIDYTALSLVVPRKNQFRYKLVGHDRIAGRWRAAARRSPQTYRRVTIDFRLLPVTTTVSGTNRARAWTLPSYRPSIRRGGSPRLCISAGAGALWLLYLLRVRQIGCHSYRLEERVIERERIARELHDTLCRVCRD